MNAPGDLLLSVRGEARQLVAPDSASMAAAITVSRGSKAEALRAAAAALDRLTADCAAQGGVALDEVSGRHPLTWSARSATTHEERAQDGGTGRYEPTGRMMAAVDVMITVRAFELLDTLGAILATHERFSVNQVMWYVD